MEDLKPLLEITDGSSFGCCGLILQALASRVHATLFRRLSFPCSEPLRKSFVISAYLSVRLHRT
jgi:hypothetical protein